MRNALRLETATMAVFVATVSTVSAGVAAAPGETAAGDSTGASNTASAPATGTAAPSPGMPAAANGTVTATGGAVTLPATQPVSEAEFGRVIRTERVDFTGPLKDFFSQHDWMVVEIDFDARSNPNPEAANSHWIPDVEVMLTLAWGRKSTTTPQIDLALTSSIKLLAIETYRTNVVFFFVPPEVLQRGLHGRALEARIPPAFYVVQYRIGGVPQKIFKSDVSFSLPDAKWWDGFLTAAGPKMGNAGWLMNAAQAPQNVVGSAASRVSAGNPIPTYLPNINAGR